MFSSLVIKCISSSSFFLFFFVANIIHKYQFLFKNIAFVVLANVVFLI